MIALIISIVIGALVIAFLWVIVRFNLKRRYIGTRIEAAPHHVLAHVYKLIDQAASIDSTACVLCPTNQWAPDARIGIVIPAWLPDFPWAGRHVSLSVGTDAKFVIEQQTHGLRQLAGQQYHPVKVLRGVTLSGERRNLYEPNEYLSQVLGLSDALRVTCDASPNDTLSYLFCPGGQSFEYEPLNQLRIAGCVEWVQEPDVPLCDLCGRDMTFVLQMPGSMLLPGKMGEATFYLFGCIGHPDRYETMEQWN